MTECECLGELAAQCIFRTFLTVIVVIIDKQIVQRRDVVIRRGRQLQNLLRLPEWMRVFSETDPGMLDKDIRTSAECLAASSLSAGLGVTAALAKGTLWDFWALSLGVAIPVCINIVVWLMLIHSKRRQSRAQPLLIGNGYRSKEQGGRHYDHSAGDLGVDESIRAVWFCV
ncbi:hypothetical protein QBC46DRAFT_439664 [Diplogelasinospora grovesii]|uniref:Uncharacterized protein n=1 Tax=Diplogelasinospora grovesii TaxID=303347 RepID=A0AAN6S2J4_9PEZI|nr:hypothetical protein QBC46DRAFT_439664 [Diplogelasinospora grovesii]